MSLRSHVDMCLFVRIMRADVEHVSSQGIEDLDRAKDVEPALRLWRAQYEAHTTTWFHELYHYWQGLRLPFLFWFACYSFRWIMTGFRDFMRSNLPFDQWNGIAPQLEYLSLKQHCLYMGVGEFILRVEDVPPPSGWKCQAMLSPLDLIEGATSIAEWQVQSPTHGPNTKEFFRWCKRHPAYVDAFQFVTQALGSDELALRCFNPLVEAAFHTSQPVRGFVELLSRFIPFLESPIGKAFIAQNEPCRWSFLFQDFLSEIEFEAKPNSIRGVYLEMPFCLMERDTWIEASWDGADFLHPYLTPNARTWSKLEKQDPLLSLVLSQLPWSSQTAFDTCVNNFYPPLTLLHLAATDGKNRLIVTGGERQKDPALDPLASGNLLWLLTAFSVVRRATGSHFDPGLRLCHHSNCPRYEGNYCNLYPVIPARWQDCGFPDRVQEIIDVLSHSK
ncbi:hypothetical protein EDE15_2742 [Edaphobacter aggregans]|uniref:Uncharacterized protein n=1 Tax=Edaphobacter aggregans TaxID=570835 RepID=A0A428MK08_9BACT|nr:hypothetical protein [Edaphobacter aggregans]RSL17212.1 hypothetical protein EDE15_2742 [Edaphobacter aggregans]